MSSAHRINPSLFPTSSSLLPFSHVLFFFFFAFAAFINIETLFSIYLFICRLSVPPPNTERFPKIFSHLGLRVKNKSIIYYGSLPHKFWFSSSESGPRMFKQALPLIRIILKIIIGGAKCELRKGRAVCIHFPLCRTPSVAPGTRGLSVTLYWMN